MVETPDPAAALVDPHGKPTARRKDEAKRCPRCAAGSEKRVASGGFGEPHPVCSRCGHDFVGERWNG